MAKYSVKDFVKSFGIKEGTVKSWLHRKKLHKDSEGLIDTENPINKLLISEMQLKSNGNLLASSNKKTKQVEVKNEQLEIPLTESQKQYQEIDYRTRVATAEAKEREAELKRIQLEKIAGNLLPIDIAESIFTINIQSIFRNFESELENLASIYVPDRSILSDVIQKQKELLVKIIEKSKEDAFISIENAINDYSETRSRGERK